MNTIPALSDVDVRILALAAEGHTDREISRALDLKFYKTQQLFRAIRIRLGAANRANAVLIALQRGIIQ